MKCSSTDAGNNGAYGYYKPDPCNGLNPLEVVNKSDRTWIIYAPEKMGGMQLALDPADFMTIDAMEASSIALVWDKDDEFQLKKLEERIRSMAAMQRYLVAKNESRQGEKFTAEMAKMRAYGRKHGFDVQTHVVKPPLLSTFQLKVLSGRGIPSFAGTQADCSNDLKRIPQRTHRRQLLKALAAEGREALVCLGTRYDESTKRAFRMAMRGEREDIPVPNDDNELVLSPIAFWTAEDVFEYLGNGSSGLMEAYSDFKDTLRIYAHSAGTSCAVVADAIYEGMKQQKGNGCRTSRTGCYLCQQAEDKSLAAMVTYSSDYAYAEPLVRLNNYIRATRHDYSRRHWVGRTIQAGFIAIEPDTYHPAFIRELTRYMLQIDYDEELRAARKRESPRFRILPVDMMIALDAMQSLNGVALPFQIWADYHEIRSGEVRYNVPVIDPVLPAPMPAARFLYVGDDWQSGSSAMTGLRDAYIESLTADSPCEPQLKALKDGREAWGVVTDQTFNVDLESAAMILDFELENMLKTHYRGLPPSGITYAYKWYLMYGVLELSHGQRAKHDEVLRRTAFKDRLGLTVDYDIDDLYARAIPFSELPPAARRVWGGKARTETAQVEMDLSLLFT